MLMRKSKSSRYVGVVAASLMLVVIALFILTPSAHASGGGCSNWYASYWNNRDLHGQPDLMRCDTAIDFDWHGLSPDASINVENFSARWTRTYNFAAGNYRFKATMDDGMRVFLDGKAIINDWQDGKARTNEADIYLHSGAHKLVVEYYEAGGNAVAGFTWEALDGQPMPPHPKPPMHSQPMPPMYPMQPMQPMQPMYGMPGDNVEYPVAEVKAAYLNVRSGPGVSNPVVGVLRQNAIVYMVARSSGGKWILIRSGGLEGWVNKYYLHTSFPFTSLSVAGGGAPMPPHPQPPMPGYDAVVNASSLNVRGGPGVQYRAIAVVHGGTGVQVMAKNPNGWVQVRIPTGTVGWVNGAYLTYR